MVGIFSFISHNHDIHIEFDEYGIVWFCAFEIAEILGYHDTNSMVRHLPLGKKGTSTWCTLGGDQEVLPSIRMTGGYLSPEVMARIQQNTNFINELITRNQELQH